MNKKMIKKTCREFEYLYFEISLDYSQQFNPNTNRNNYTLEDIEYVAHALSSNYLGVFNGVTLTHIDYSSDVKLTLKLVCRLLVSPCNCNMEDTQFFNFRNLFHVMKDRFGEIVDLSYNKDLDAISILFSNKNNIVIQQNSSSCDQNDPTVQRLFTFADSDSPKPALSIRDFSLRNKGGLNPYGI